MPIAPALSRQGETGTVVVVVMEEEEEEDQEIFSPCFCHPCRCRRQCPKLGKTCRKGRTAAAAAAAEANVTRDECEGDPLNT